MIDTKTSRINIEGISSNVNTILIKNSNFSEIFHNLSDFFKIYFKIIRKCSKFLLFSSVYSVLNTSFIETGNGAVKNKLILSFRIIDFLLEVCYNTFCVQTHLGVAQVVARHLGVVEAVGSSPVTQTKIVSTGIEKSTCRNDFYFVLQILLVDISHGDIRQIRG